MGAERIVAWKHDKPGCHALTIRPAAPRGDDKPPVACDWCRQHGEFTFRELDRRPIRRLL